MSVSAKSIKTARLRLGESQERFAQRFGVNQSTVARWEAEGPTDRGTAAMMIQRVLQELRAAAQAAE